MKDAKDKDAKIFKLAGEVSELSLKKKECEEQLKEKRSKLAGFFAKRKIRGLSNDQLQLSYVKPEKVEVDFEYIFEFLTPKQKKMCTITIIDESAISLLMQQGKIDQEIVDKASTIVPSTPYVKITLKK